jgi:multidrug efflux pump subunit AcrA (membrane-fusion protein)
MEIRAPADGVVMERLIEPGSKLVQTLDDPHSGHAVRLFDPKHLQVRVDVPLADAAKVGVGMDARIVVGVLPDRTFDGKVTRIVQQADVSKNTLQVKVAIVNPAPQLKPEMLARVRFIPSSGPDGPTTRASQVVFAPEKYLTRMSDHFSVWVLNPADSSAQLRMVRTGSDRHDGWVSVLSGLNPGDAIITDTDGLSDGARVKVVGELDEAKGGGDGAH